MLPSCNLHCFEPVAVESVYKSHQNNINLSLHFLYNAGDSDAAFSEDDDVEYFKKEVGHNPEPGKQIYVLYMLIPCLRSFVGYRNTVCLSRKNEVSQIFRIIIRKVSNIFC